MRAGGLFARLGLIAATLCMTACSPPGPKSFDDMSADEHLACVVEINAYTYLMAAGTIPVNPEQAGQSALAAAWHHNAYAIPLGLSQQYELISKQRNTLIAKESPAAIEARAIACITVAVTKNEAK